MYLEQMSQDFKSQSHHQFISVFPLDAKEVQIFENVSSGFALKIQCLVVFGDFLSVLKLLQFW